MANRVFRVAKATVLDFLADDAMSLGAAIAYYTALSMAPLIVLALWFAGLLGESAQDGLIQEIRGLIGPSGGEAVGMIVESADDRPSLGNVAGIFSLLTLAFGASAVFAQLQASMNRIWDVEAKPGQGIVGWIRKRLLCFGMIVTVLFLLLVSTVVSAGLAAASERTADLPGGTVLWDVVYVIASLLVFTTVFALMFRFLPDAKVVWRDVWIGAAVTAVLFAIGKIAVGVYLGTGSVGSAYGAAGSLIVLLIWAFYSSLIFFLGAESTQVYAQDRGRRIVPDPHAVKAKGRAH